MKVSSNYGLVPQNNSRPAFKRNWPEHVSWGANYIRQSKKADFKLFTFPDAKKVFVEIAQKADAKFGNIKERVVQLFMLQGAALSLTGISAKDDETKLYPLENKGNGVFEAKDIEAQAGAQYRFVVAKDDADIRLVKDPYAKKQSDINGWSELYDQSAYEWKNTDWLEGKDSRRIVRKPNEPLRGLENLVIEEVNIPTLSTEGTFDAAKKHIDDIANRGVATAVEIMPVENTYSLQWGYDGVDKFAVNEKLGGPDKLKELVDYIHGKGLNVIMDMVPNHIGPDGNYLPQAGPYSKGAGEYGDVPNYEGMDNRYVRDWMVNEALWWANEFKVDGIRFDMTKKCESDWLLRQIVDEVNEHNPDVFLIAEDGDENRWAITAYAKFDDSHDKKIGMIDTYVKQISESGYRTNPWGIGFDSEWDFPFVREMKNNIIDYNGVNIDIIDEKIRNNAYRVKYVMSHDEIGNLDGTRLIPKVMSMVLGLSGKVHGNSDPERGQRAAQASQKIAELCATENVSGMSKRELHKKLEEYGLHDIKHITPENLQSAFDTARAKQRLALGVTMTIPGPKMYFQGDDSLDLSQFKFFREFSGGQENRKERTPESAAKIFEKKGYDTLEPFARPDCILGKVDNVLTKYIDEMTKYSVDLSNIVKNSPALIKGELVGTYKDNNHKVHIHQLKSGDDEVLVIKNFGRSFHNKEYGISYFPQGNWKEIFNSDNEEYGGMNYVNTDKVISPDNQNISFAPNSIVILKKV